jgi:hypothetical protein
MKRMGLAAQLGLFVVLTVGAALAWGVAAGFFATLWETHLSSARRITVYENLSVDYDGTPLISAYSYAGNRYQQLPYRTLDGETVEAETIQELSPGFLPSKPQPWRGHDGPRQWSGRLSSASDGRPAPTLWMLVRDATDEGLTYLAGYDAVSQLCVGYIGREGFRGETPAQDEQFALGPEALNYYRGAHFAGAGLGGIGRQPDNEGVLKTWLVFLIDGDRVAEVDLRKRSVRTLMESPDLVSLSLIYRPLAGEGAAGSADGKVGGRLAVRLSDRIVIINPTGEDRSTFPLPEALRQAKSMSAYQISDDELLLVRGGDNPYSRVHELTWLDGQGKVTRERSVKLAGHGPGSDREAATIAVAVVPMPGVITPLLAGPAAWSKLQFEQAKDYRDALAQIVRAGWPPYVLLLAVCAGAAWWVVRRQREHAWPHTGVWCAAVFLTGVPGLVAYLIEHRREARAACPACGRVVPRKRESCAACGGAFPEPRLTGVEVFA